jgi:hypothetical protein
MTNLIQIEDSRERAVRLCELHKHWTANIRVSVWGRAKATLVDKKMCPGHHAPAKYDGDCDECSWFMGADTANHGNPVRWGDQFPGCCALILESSLALENTGTE